MNDKDRNLYTIVVVIIILFLMYQYEKETTIPEITPNPELKSESEIINEAKYDWQYERDAWKMSDEYQCWEACNGFGDPICEICAEKY